MGLEPERQLMRLHALCAFMRRSSVSGLERDPGVEGRQHHARVLLHRQELLQHQLLAGAQRAGQHPALAVEVLGARVHHDVGAELDRALQRWRREAVVDRQQRADIMRQLGQRRDVTDTRRADWSASRRTAAG